MENKKLNIEFAIATYPWAWANWLLENIKDEKIKSKVIKLLEGFNKKENNGDEFLKNLKKATNKIIKLIK